MIALWHNSEVSQNAGEFWFRELARTMISSARSLRRRSTSTRPLGAPSARAMEKLLGILWVTLAVCLLGALVYDISY
jgi:hypothetical protein